MSESQSLEFKSAMALAKPDGVTREVVGMLNSGAKGEVWVGFTDEDSVATKVEAIEDAGKQVVRLYDLFIDTIDPAPTGQELRVEVHADNGGEVIRIEVQGQADRMPYCQLKKGTRAYHLRVGERIRSMSGEEIRAAYGATDQQSSHGEQDVPAGRRALWVQEPGASLYIELRPRDNLELDARWDDVKQLLMVPSRTGNRSSGWTFAAPYDAPRVGQGTWAIGAEGGPETKITKRGEIEFKVPIEALRLTKSDVDELMPIPLLEYPSSLMRLARTLNALPGACRSPVWSADMVITGLNGWRLRPHSPGSYSWEVSSHPWESDSLYESDVFQLENAISIEAEDLEAAPDYCAFRMYRQLYEAFGYGEDKIPSEYDREARRLNLAN